MTRTGPPRREKLRHLPPEMAHPRRQTNETFLGNVGRSGIVVARQASSRRNFNASRVPVALPSHQLHAQRQQRVERMRSSSVSSASTLSTASSCKPEVELCEHGRHRGGPRPRRNSLESLRPPASRVPAQMPSGTTHWPNGCQLRAERDEELEQALMSARRTAQETGIEEGDAVIKRFHEFMRERALRDTVNQDVLELPGRGTELERELFANYSQIREAWQLKQEKELLERELNPPPPRRHFCDCEMHRQQAKKANAQLEQAYGHEREPPDARFVCSDLYDTDLYGILAASRDDDDDDDDSFDDLTNILIQHRQQPQRHFGAQPPPIGRQRSGERGLANHADTLTRHQWMKNDDHAALRQQGLKKWLHLR